LVFEERLGGKTVPNRKRPAISIIPAIFM